MPSLSPTPRVWTRVTNQRPWSPFEIHIFEPRSTQRSPCRNARVDDREGSEPASGSLMANAASDSGRPHCGRRCPRMRDEPCCQIISPTML
jgi:hypothetical protein